MIWDLQVGDENLASPQIDTLVLQIFRELQVDEVDMVEEDINNLKLLLEDVKGTFRMVHIDFVFSSNT